MDFDYASATFKEHLRLSEDPQRLIIMMQGRGLLANSMQCICGRWMNMQSRNERTDNACWRCPVKNCKRRVSVRRGSYFEKSRLPLGQLWMIIVCNFRFPKMLGIYIADILDISEQAVVDWGRYIRETISHYYLENPLRLGGANAVQIDESLFGGRRKYNLGNHFKHIKSWVFGMVEENTGRCVLWAVRRRNRETLTNIIVDHVHSGSTIKSDQWGAYSQLSQIGFEHLTVNHSINFVSADGTHTQLIESVWSQVKGTLKQKRGTNKRGLAGYLDLYSFFCDAKSQQRSVLDLFVGLIQMGNYY